MKLAVVGATGLVGREILTVLEEHQLMPDELIPVASERSIGSYIIFNGSEIRVQSHEHAIAGKPDYAIFSAGAAASKQWAPHYANAGVTVIDNSSAWRMDPEIPLIVPEINGHVLRPSNRIIANPNCATIQLVMVLAPIHARYIIKRVVVATYQSVSGTGANAVRQLENERAGIAGPMAYPYPIDLNLFPHGGDFLDNGYTTEEMKLLNESRKILNDNTMAITSTIVRVPVIGGHSEAVNIELMHDFNISDVRSLLEKTPGVIVSDDPPNKLYPMPLYARGKDDVFVGRIRRDDSCQNALNLFIVADNLRKGAATNAVQIVEFLLARSTSLL